MSLSFMVVDIFFLIEEGGDVLAISVHIFSLVEVGVISLSFISVDRFSGE